MNLKTEDPISLFTKPDNKEMFEDMGFYTVLMTDQVLFMENKRNGFEEFIKRLIQSPLKTL